VTFHTGRALTAPAAKDAFERTINEGSAGSLLASVVESIEALNDRELRFTLSAQAPFDLMVAAGEGAFIYDTEVDAPDLKAWFVEGNSAGTGPYQATDWSPGQEFQITMEAYGDYWGGWEDTQFDTVIYRVVPEPTTAAQLLQAGDVTFAQSLTAQLFASLSSDSTLAQYESPGWLGFFLQLNTLKAPFDDVRVRQAVAKAIDYDGIVTALAGSGTRTLGMIPAGLLGYNADAATHVADVAEATRLLAEAGYSESNRLSVSLTYTQGIPHEEIAVPLIRSNLAEVGIDVTVTALAWPAQWELAKSPNPADRQDMTVAASSPRWPSASAYFENLLVTGTDPILYNLSYFSNARLDELAAQVDTVAISDQAAAQAIYDEMTQIVYDEAPLIPLINWTNQRTALASMTGYVDNPSYSNVVFVYETRAG
jgi:peptide/nickel transport system substrate-binding protein